MDFSEEEIVRFEAYNFFQKEKHSIHGYNIDLSYLNPRIFNQQLKERLLDFFTHENKVFFLDELINHHTEFKNRILNRENINTNDQKRYKYNLETSLFYINQLLKELPTLVKKTESSNSIILRDSIFVSYSHKDLEIVNSFKRHFKPIERNHNIDLWDDSRILPGQKWKDEIKLAIQKAKIAIFVLSADFFASEFIANEELPELLKAANEEGATILSIIAKPCDFKNSQLSIYQAMNDPNNTLLSMSELHKEELWVNLVTQVRRVLDLK